MLASLNPTQRPIAYLTGACEQALRHASAPGAAGAQLLLRLGAVRALVLLARPAHQAAAAAWPPAGGGGPAGARAAALAALDLLHAPFCAAATPGAVLRDLQAVRRRHPPRCFPITCNNRLHGVSPWGDQLSMWACWAALSLHLPSQSCGL